MTRRLACRIVAVLALAAIADLGASPYQGNAKKPIVFSGRVEGCDLKLDTVAVKHGDIPGFMPAMTLDYMVESGAVLKQLSRADEISATVYVGDPTLHNVHVVAHNPNGKRCS